MIVLDASVLIAYLDSDDEHHAAAEALLTEAIDDDLGASPLTLAEVLGVPVRDTRLQPVLAAFRDLELNELPFPPDSAVRLARQRVSTGQKMPDCCVLLAAQGADGIVATFDARLAQAAEDLGVPVLRG